MIKILRQDSRSIYIEFDKEGSHSLLKMFNEIYNEKEFELSAEFDMGVLKMRKGGTIKSSIISCKKNSEDQSVFTIENDNIMWKMDEDDIEMGIEKFTECEQQGYFFPAEFIRICTPRNKKLDYIYCKLVHSHG